MTAPTENPFAPTPYLTATNTLVSGGGADGYIDHVVALCLRRVNVAPPAPVAALPEDADYRQFDLAELISRSAAAAGVPGALPITASSLLLYCRSHRTTITVAAGLALKGALLFGQGSVGLSLGSRRRAIVYTARSGLAVDADASKWTGAARLPGARGYR